MTKAIKIISLSLFSMHFSASDNYAIPKGFPSGRKTEELSQYANHMSI